MKKTILTLLAGALLFFVQGTAAQASDTAVLKAMLEENGNLPIDQAMANIGPLLFTSEILLPKAGDSKPADEEGRQSIALLTAPDKDGQIWFYAYTDEEEMLKVFPEGAQYIAMNFTAFLNTIQEKENLGGIFINSGSHESSFPVPAEFLKQVKLDINYD